MEGIDNEKMSLFFSDRIEYLEFIVISLTKSQIFYITESYQSFDNDIILNELEAFGTARHVKPNTIVKALRAVCKK